MHRSRPPLVHLFPLPAVILAVGLFLCSPPLAAAQSAETRDDRPNVVLIFSDDHAIQALGAYGGRLASLDPTPQLDRLAAQGMLFRNAFVTNSLCAPSRATILSGQHSHLNGIRGNEDVLNASVQTFPERLQAAGYQTALIGKWHLKSDPRGFDYWEVLPGQGEYYNPTFRRPEGRTAYTGYVSDIITDRTLRWLQEERSDDAPFLLMYQHKAPHRQWQPGPDHLTTYDDVTVPPPPTLFADHETLSSAALMQEMEIDSDLDWGGDLKLRWEPGENGGLTYWHKHLANRLTMEQRTAWNDAYGPKNADFHRRFTDGTLLGRDLTLWKYQRYVKDYLRTVRSMDDQIGRLLDALDRQGLADDTIVIYTSDQGFFLGEKGWFDKRWMYEESLRMPLLVRWPGVVAAGSENTNLIQNLDLAQTMLDAADVEAPSAMQGRSLVPLLRGHRSSPWRDAIYYHYYDYAGPHRVMRHEGVRTDRYKLIHYYPLAQWELFDLDADPRELNNLYGHPDYIQITSRLKKRLSQLKDQYDVPPALTNVSLRDLRR